MAAPRLPAECCRAKLLLTAPDLEKYRVLTKEDEKIAGLSALAELIPASEFTTVEKETDKRVPV